MTLFKKAAHNLPRVSRIRPLWLVGQYQSGKPNKFISVSIHFFFVAILHFRHKYIVSYISTIWYSGIESRGLQRANHLFTEPHLSLLWLGIPLSLCPSSMERGHCFGVCSPIYVVHVAGVKCFIPPSSFGIMRTLFAWAIPPVLNRFPILLPRNVILQHSGMW